jgi:hypothetical protein
MSDSIPQITRDQVAELARQIWESEGQPEGQADDHWRRAEAQLRQKQIEALAAETDLVVPQPVGLS